MIITLVDNSAVPFYEQIKEQIKAAILSGEIEAGAMLPSVRRLARKLRVSNITTLRAYKDLEDEGLVKSIHGRGSFVYRLPEEIIYSQYDLDIERDIENTTQNSQTIETQCEEQGSKLAEKYSVLNKIALFRKAQCLKQAELAKALRTSRQMIVAYETNASIPSLPMAFKIARFFGCAIDEMFLFIPDV
jgi:GntR family transcriptional regulator